MKYFTIEELCKSATAEICKIDNSPSEEIKSHLIEMVDNLLDPLREHIGAAIDVTSGYRCVELNKMKGGSPTSSHLTGYAADVHTDVMSINTFWHVILKFCKENNIKYDQIYTETDGYSSWIHIGYKKANGDQRMMSGHWVKK